MADFKCIFKGLPGAEGPVFDVDGNFYAVAPEIEEAGRFRGQLFHLDLTNNAVSVLDIISALLPLLPGCSLYTRI